MTTTTAGLVGRAAELARLERAAAAAAAGRSTVVALVGAYGLGKTALLDVVAAEGHARGATVLATQGRAADAELGFASLLTLLRPVEARLDELAGDLAPELRAALALGRQADPVAVRVATLRVLSALAAEGPLLVLVDDAHLLDCATADVLAFAAGRFYADAVLVVVATEQYAATAFDGLGPDTIGLDELDDEQITRIIDAAVPLAPEPLRRCVELADGNPLAALELAASLDAAQRTGAAPLPVVPRLSGIIVSAFAQRLDRLDEAARNALAMVAADDTGELAVVVDALARLGEPEGGLAQAEAAGLVTTDGGSVRFTHPLLRPVAYHQIGAASRRVAHGALAAVLAAPHQGASRAWQQVAAAERPDAAVAAALALVAGDIARRGGTASAARTLECAAALAPGVEQRRDHLVAATRAWLDAGEGRAAARVAEALAALPPTSESVAAAAAAFRGTRPAAQVLAFVTAAERAVDPDEQPATAAVLADELLAAGAVADAIALATALSTSASLTDPAVPAGRLAEAVLAAAGVGSPHLPEGDPDDGGEPAGARDAGGVADRARTLATAAAVDAGLRPPGGQPHRAGPLVAVGGAGLDLAVSRALAALHAGEVADAHDQLLRLDAVVGDTPGTGRDRLDLALAEAELLVGRSADATGRAAAVAARADEQGLGWLRSRAEWTLGRIALAAGDDDRAAGHLRAACRVIPHLAGADLVTALAAADRPTEAEARAVGVRRFAGDPAPVLDVRSRRAAGALGPAHRQTELEAALERAEAEGLPLEAAAVAMTRAEGAWRAGDLDVAKAAAREAANRWAACGVSGWKPRLTRLQRRAPAATPALATLLSPAEHRVAVAVAEGRTNQEAAETLYLSVKTIDFHLQNIYRKLGLRSRTELAVVVHHGAVPEQVAS
jgi:DNA-binding NarL/FixJ family response regulator